MRNMLRNSLMLVAAVCTMLPSISYAQAERAEGAIYLRPHIGIAYYLGDNEKSPFNFDGDLFDDGLPYSAGVELGYQFNPRYSLGLGVTFGKYTGITEFVNGMDISDHPSTRTSVSLLARYLLSEGRIAPYLVGGLHASFGTTAVYAAGACLTTGPCAESDETSFGPSVGVGLDFLINDNTSFFLEHGAHLTFSDTKADGYDGNGFGGFDFLGRTAAGLKFNLTRFVPVVVESVVCPADAVETGTPITFSGAVNEKATQPVVATWDFGDGATAPGLTATHTFTSAGTYDVSLTAANGKGKGRDVRTCPVTVNEACQEASIVSMRASSMDPDTQTVIRFSANVAGTPEISYVWDFGDGTTSSSTSPTHTYSSAGSYTVTLEVTNCGGSVSRTMTVTVDPYEAAICREVTEMNAAFFTRNSSTLTTEAREALRENLEILLECPNLNARLEGWAAPGERRAQELSEDRARAVEQFYVDNGVPASRLVTAGMGRATGTSKKEGSAGYRRVDTIPVR